MNPPPLARQAKSPVPWVVAAVCQVVVFLVVGVWAAAQVGPAARVNPPVVPVATDGSGTTVAVTDAASDFVVLMTTFDYDDFDAATARVLERATGALVGEFRTTMAQFKDAYVAEQATSVGEVQSVGVSDPSIAPGSGVELLVFGSVTRSGETGREPTVTTFRMKLLMVVVDGVWKAAKAENI